MTPKNLIIAIIERELELFDMANALESAGVSIKGFGARSGLVSTAFCGDDDLLVDQLDEIYWKALETKTSTAEAIYEAMRQRAAEVKK